MSGGRNLPLPLLISTWHEAGRYRPSSATFAGLLQGSPWSCAYRRGSYSASSRTPSALLQKHPPSKTRPLVIVSLPSFIVLQAQKADLLQAQPNLETRGNQIQVVDYDDLNSLEHALAGIDIIISTVSGAPQLALIKAAVNAGVRRFAPAEFEGRPSLRQDNDPLDRGRASALAYLEHYRQYFEATTVFVCGVLYERFQPGGLAAGRIGASTSLSQEGNFILDLRYMTAQVPAYDSTNQPSYLCMTAAQDAARLVVAALDMPTWPREFRMYGERLKAYDLVSIARSVRGKNYTVV